MSKQPRRWLVPLTAAQIDHLISAIDSRLHEDANDAGWPVNSGYVIDPRLDRAASDRPLDDDERAACEAIDEHDALEHMLREFTNAENELVVEETVRDAVRDGVVPVNQAGLFQLRAWLDERVEADVTPWHVRELAFTAIVALGAK